MLPRMKPGALYSWAPDWIRFPLWYKAIPQQRSSLPQPPRSCPDRPMYCRIWYPNFS